MSERAFFEASAKKDATAAIQAIEAQTSAEVVVTLRHASGSYRSADFAWGFVASVQTLLLLLYVDKPFPLWSFPLNVVLGFGVGAVISAYVPFLRRLITTPKQRAELVRRAARTSFVDLRVHRCTGRWGILVYVSTFERAVEIVADLAIEEEDEGYAAACAQVRAAVARLDAPGFLAALRTLGPPLAGMHPHRDDDVNELPDEVGGDEDDA